MARSCLLPANRLSCCLLLQMACHIVTGYLITAAQALDNAGTLSAAEMSAVCVALSLCALAANVQGMRICGIKWGEVDASSPGAAKYVDWGIGFLCFAFGLIRPLEELLH